MNIAFNLFDEILAIEDNLIQFLIKDKSFTLVHFKLMEDLLYHKYLIKPADKNLKEITLTVLKYVSKNDTNYLFERIDRINELTA